MRSWLVILTLAAGVAKHCPAAEPAPPAAKAVTEATLADQQAQILQRYGEFEALVGRMSDLLKRTDPDRAALLTKAFAQSRKDLIASQMEKVAADLRATNINEAIKGADPLNDDLVALLDLLLSEDRTRRLKERRERVEKYLAEMQRLKRRQQEIRSATERTKTPDQDAEKLEGQQNELKEKTKQLEEKIRREDGDDKKGAKDSKPSPGDEKKSGNKDGKEGGKESKPSDSKAQPGGESGDGDPKNGSGKLQQAQRAMEQARRQLEQKKKEPASDAQDEAIRQLQEAIKELEEILRQLRQEEQRQMLESLESRFKKMLEMEKVIHDGTVTLGRTPADRFTRADEQKALALSRRQTDVIKEIDQALFVMREDGSAMAMPEAAEQARSDMILIESLLGKSDTGSMTQNLEKDVIAALEEMIASLADAIRQAREAESGEGGGSQENMNLINRLQEIRMVRSLQQRVYRRTIELSKTPLANGKLSEEIKTAIRGLVERQSRVYEITRDIARETGQ